MRSVLGTHAFGVSSAAVFYGRVLGGPTQVVHCVELRAAGCLRLRYASPRTSPCSSAGSLVRLPARTVRGPRAHARGCGPLGGTGRCGAAGCPPAHRRVVPMVSLSCSTCPRQCSMTFFVSAETTIDPQCRLWDKDRPICRPQRSSARFKVPRRILEPKPRDARCGARRAARTART